MRMRYICALVLPLASGVAAAGPVGDLTQGLSAHSGSFSLPTPEMGSDALTGMSDSSALSEQRPGNASDNMLTSPLEGLQPEGNQSGFDRSDEGGTLTLDGSGLQEGVEPVLTLTGERLEEGVRGEATAEESDDNASLEGILSPEQLALSGDGRGDETIDPDREKLGIPN